MKPVEAVLFDLDDTLCVYERSADEVLAAAFQAVGVDRLFDGAEYIDRFEEFTDAGDEVADIRAACFAALAEEAGHDPAVGRQVAAAYGAERDQSAVAFTPGAERALSALDGDYRIGMVTNGDPGMQSQKLAGLGVEDYFEVVVHGGVDAPYKPNAEPFHLALDELGVAPERAVHVGNSHEADVVGAHAAGLRSVWLADGREVVDLDPVPHHVVESLHDVAAEPWV